MACVDGSENGMTVVVAGMGEMEIEKERGERKMGAHKEREGCENECIMYIMLFNTLSYLYVKRWIGCTLLNY